MIKRFIFLILLCTLTLATAACAGTQADTSAEDTEDTAAVSADSETSAVSSETETAPGTDEKVIPEDSEYIIENGITDRMRALSELVPGNKARIAKVFKKALACEPITVAYLGGSITQGSAAGSVEAAYPGLTTAWFRSTFPESTVTPVYAGIGATGSYIGVHRLDRDVLSRDPDIVFIDFSVNDNAANTERDIEAFDGLIRKLWAAECSPAIVTIAMTKEDGTSFQEYHKSVCVAYDIPMISYRDAILDAIKNGHIKWTDVSSDNIHPSGVGHAVLTEMISAYLEKVLCELDTIDTGAESDLSAVCISDKYSTAYLMMPAEAQNAETCGWDKSFFGNFGEAFVRTSSDGTFSDVETLRFEVEAKSIGILFGKVTRNGGKLDILVDGEKVKTIDCAFTGGWGNYVEAAEIIDFDECGIHTVEIVPKGGKNAYVVFSALTLTK